MKFPNKYLLNISLLIALISSCQNSSNNPEINSYKLISGHGTRPLCTIPLDSIQLSDPFILADEESETYYLTGTGGLLWKSKDLKKWNGPYNYIKIDTTSWMGSTPMIWAPELHKYNNKYYCITTFTNTKTIIETNPARYDVPRRSVHILVANKPEGPYQPINSNNYLPEEWATLDGTLWVENDKPYLVFSHDWMQLVDGAIKYVQLTQDLSEIDGDIHSLFNASEALWSRDMQAIGELTYGKALTGHVSDGPFVFRTHTGKLGMLWSSWGEQRYAQGVAYSESGSINGPWKQIDTPINRYNSGHAMIFRTLNGEPMMIMHRQSLDLESPGPRYPKLFKIDLSGNELLLKE